MTPVPVTTIASVDDVLRESTSSGVLCDLPGAVAVRYHLLPDGDGVRRVVYELGGTIEDVIVPLEHSFLSCALREDILPTVVRLAASERWRAVVLALPVAAEPLPVVRALSAHVRGSAAPVRVASVAAVLDGASVCADLLGADLLAERGLGIGPEDRRAVGEVLAHQLEYADLVVTSGWLAPRAAALLEHLVTPGGTRGALYGLDAEALVSGRPDPGADARVDARRVRLTGRSASTGCGPWTCRPGGRCTRSGYSSASRRSVPDGCAGAARSGCRPGRAWLARGTVRAVSSASARSVPGAGLRRTPAWSSPASTRIRAACRTPSRPCL